MACSGMIVIIAARARHEAFAHPEFGTMDDAARRGTLTIGVENPQHTRSSYDLEVMLDDRMVTLRQSIELCVGKSWIWDFALPMPDDEAHTAKARLFKGGNDRLVYRRAWLRTGSRDPWS